MKEYNIAVCLIKNTAGKVVLVKQHFVDLDESFWSLPDGKLEASESFIEAAIREAREETSLKLSNPAELIYTCDYEDEHKGFKCQVKAYEFVTPLTNCRLKVPAKLKRLAFS